MTSILAVLGVFIDGGVGSPCHAALRNASVHAWGRGHLRLRSKESASNILWLRTCTKVAHHARHVCLHVQVVLTSALYRMAQDHPFHTLYSVIALSNGDTESGDPAAKNAHIKHMTNTGKVSQL